MKMDAVWLSPNGKPAETTSRPQQRAAGGCLLVFPETTLTGGYHQKGFRFRLLVNELVSAKRHAAELGLEAEATRRLLEAARMNCIRWAPSKRVAQVFCMFVCVHACANTQGCVQRGESHICVCNLLSCCAIGSLRSYSVQVYRRS
jgi:hypothetical protein